jgi:hypothetical protein
MPPNLDHHSGYHKEIVDIVMNSGNNKQDIFLKATTNMQVVGASVQATLLVC